MNHTLYFPDDALYKTFSRYAKAVHGSVSKALSEAMQLWLSEHQTWPDALKNLPREEDDFRFEDARKGMVFKEKDLF